MLDKMVIRDVIFHTLASFIFGVWTLWGCHRRVETSWSGEAPYFYARL